MPDQTDFAQWLNTEMPRRGYPLEGPRAGGITQLADDAGISPATMSRIVAGRQEASPRVLRAIGKIFGVPLGQMMVFAGQAEPDEMIAVSTTDETATTPGPPADEPPDDLPADLRRLWPMLPSWQKDIWNVRDTSVYERQGMLTFMDLMRGGGAPVASEQSSERPAKRRRTGDT